MLQKSIHDKCGQPTSEKPRGCVNPTYCTICGFCQRHCLEHPQLRECCREDSKTHRVA
jgi:hypothetical protein